MVVYIALFLVTLLLGLALTGKNPTKPKKIIYLVISFGLMFAVSVLRYGIGNDYFSYIRIFEEIRNTEWSGIFGLSYEPAFALVTKVLLATDVIWSANELYAIFSLLILIPVAVTIYRHSDNVWISVSVYLCLTFFYTSLSFIRQSLAVSVLILAYGFIKNRKLDYSLLRGENKSVLRFIKESNLIPVMIFAVVAVLFHYTAAVFIPLYLLSLIKPTKKYIIIFSSVSVGVLVTCLIMKAAGANPLNIVADLVTAVTGRDYSSYIGSKWFENGFGVQYLIMPLAVLALVMISYFLGWKEKKESDALLQLTLMNASIWSFITYAFIVERFSMFIFIYSVFTIPSVLNYFAEKAEEEKAKTVKPDKKMPGYSKAKSEEKQDNSFIITTVTVIGLFVYNCWSIAMNFHGIQNYTSLIPEITDAVDGLDGSDENLAAMYNNADLYTYLVQLKNTDCGFVVVGAADDFDGFNSTIRRGAEYAGAAAIPSDLMAKSPFFIQYNDRKGEEYDSHYDLEYTAGNGIVIHNDPANSLINGKTESEIWVKDYRDTKIPLPDDMLTFVLFDESGKIFDITAFEVDKIGRFATKIALE